MTIRSLILLAIVALSGCTTVGQRTFTDDAGAIRGYDPVAYFTESRPVKGSSSITANYQGGTYHFASAENRDLFKAEPERYAPQYGGYCAYGMSKGFVVSTDPNAWTIHNDKLYLNYSLGVRKTWLKNKDGHIAKADVNWADKLKNGIDG